jgi:hypothetical protein
MALKNTYYDAYLKTHVTEERETRAEDEVNEYGTFDNTWVGRLVVLRTYVIICLECQAQPDDLFSQKLKNYRTEFDAVLLQARADTLDAESNPLPTMTVALERA